MSSDANACSCISSATNGRQELYSSKRSRPLLNSWFRFLFISLVSWIKSSISQSSLFKHKSSFSFCLRKILWAAGLTLSNILSPLLYQWNNFSIAVSIRYGTWIWIIFSWPIRSRRPILCSSKSGFKGKSKKIRWCANWKFLPSEPISEHNMIWLPFSSSANQAAERSRSISDISSWKTAAWIPNFSLRLSAMSKTVCLWAAINKNFLCLNEKSCSANQGILESNFVQLGKLSILSGVSCRGISLSKAFS